jgi:NADH-quinone oxidoreductase subunit C
MIAEQAVTQLKEKFGASVIDTIVFHGDHTVHLKGEIIRDACQFLRDAEGLEFDMLIDVIGLDRFNPGTSEKAHRYVNDPYDRTLRTRTESYSPEERFEILYQLYSLKQKEYLRLKIRVPESGVKVKSVVPVWPAANWHEREVYDMFGIEFEDHPDLRRIYMPDYFEYYPLRKDFPLLGIPGSLPLPDRQ